MSDPHPEHGIQHAPSHAAPPGHGHEPGAALPFTDQEWEEFHRSDIEAGKMIVGLLGGIFVVGLVLYAIIAGIAYFGYGPLA